MSRPIMSVSLVVGPNCELESFAIRSTLEYFGIRVNMHWIGRPNDFVDVLSGKELDKNIDYLILNFHGDEGRFCMPELGEDVYEINEPRGEFFGIEEVKKCANLKGIKVISAGCTLGIDQLAKTFLECGCPIYIGPVDYIDGNANLMFILKFMYELINNNKSVEEAFKSANDIDEETKLYKLHKN